MSAAVMEIKMSATQSCRVNEERHKQSPVQRVNTSMPVYCHVARALFFPLELIYKIQVSS